MWIVLLIAAVIAPASIGGLRLVSRLAPVKADEYQMPYTGM
jgi:hypothetical protein